MGAEQRNSGSPNLGYGEDVAFELRHIGPAGSTASVTLKASCNYSWAENGVTDSQDEKTTSMGIYAGSGPTPYLLSCPAKYGRYVSSVFVQANTSVPDANAKNNFAYWDKVTGGNSN